MSTEKKLDSFRGHSIDWFYPRIFMDETGWVPHEEYKLTDSVENDIDFQCALNKQTLQNEYKYENPLGNMTGKGLFDYYDNINLMDCNGYRHRHDIDTNIFDGEGVHCTACYCYPATFEEFMEVIKEKYPLGMWKNDENKK